MMSTTTTSSPADSQTEGARPGQTSMATMEELWRRLAEHFAWYLDTTPRDKRTAAMLGQIRRFLKDNDVAADASHKVDPRERLDSLLTLGIPFGGPDGTGH